MAKQNKGRKFFAASATAALVASAIVPVASAAQVNDYNKISGYAKEAVQSLVDAGVIQGDTNGNFNPLNTVTRAQAAEIFTKALELEADGDVNFSDVKKGAWYYNSIAAVVANGIFEGVSAKEFAPNKSLTRSEAAKVLVDAFGLEGSESLSQFADASQVKGWAKSALETAVANGIFTGSEENGKLNLKPNAAITRQDFAVVFARTLELVDTEAPADATVKAINNTTVEVTFDEKVGNLDELKFAIDGLEIKNKAHKQSNDKVVVLTTAAQEAGKEYTVKLDGEEIGKFKGVAAVIPTAIDVVEKSQQNVLGNNVTVKAKVTVAEGQSKAGIPVTFNIINSPSNNTNVNNNSLNQPIVAEAVTDENGVATYTYTRYASTAHELVTADEVQAYATGKATVRSFAKVYWAAIQPLSITEVATGTSINNGASKQYKVKLAGVNSGTALANKKVNVAFKENLNILPDKAVKTVNVTDANGANLGYPGQYVTSAGNQTANGYKVVELTLNDKGETTFTLTGSNATVTPIVFVDNYQNTTNTDPSYGRFDETELFAQAAPVTFAKVQTLGLTVENLGVSNAAAYKGTAEGNALNALLSSSTEVKTLPTNTGGRTYKATLTNPDGKTVVSNTPVKVSVAFGTAQNKANTAAEIYLYDINAKKVVKVVSNKADDRFEYTLKTDTKGQVSFKLLGEKDAYATPTFFTETGDKTGLDANDLQTAGEIVYFGDAKVETAKLLVDDKAENNAVVYEETEFVYSTVDQNDNEYESAQSFTVTFAVSTTSNVANVKQGIGTQVTGYGNNTLPDTVNQGSTHSYAVKSVGSKASIKVDAANGTQVSVSASAGSFPLSTAKVTFAKLNNEGVAEGQEVRGKVVAIDRANNRILLTDSKGINVYELTYAASEIYYRGTAVTEPTFEGAGNASLQPGQELHFVQKNGTTPAKFDNLGYDSGIKLDATPTTLKTINIKGDNTSKVKEYDFNNQVINANFQISGDQVTLKRATINGDVNVGSSNATQADVLNDFALNGVTVGGTVHVNQGDGETFTVTGGSINRVVLNVKEHIALENSATINTVEVNKTGSYFTGVGTINTAILANNVTLGTAPAGQTPVVPGQTITNGVAGVPFTAATTSADTIKLTFTEAVTTSDVAVVELLANNTTADTATVATTADSKSLNVTLANTTDVKTKSVEVTFKGVKYVVAYNSTNNTWSITKK